MDVKIVAHATMHDQIRTDVNPVVLYVAFRPTPIVSHQCLPLGFDRS